MNYGESASVHCSIVSGDFPILVEWYFNGLLVTEVDTLDRITVASVGKRTKALAIDGVNEQYAGNYTCKASNRAGSVLFSAELIVDGERVKILCLFQSFPFSTPENFPLHVR